MALNLSRTKEEMADQGDFITSHDNLVPEVNSSSIVFSNINNVETGDAEYLCVYELQEKLKRTGEHFDIGGTYSDSKPELWFYFTTTICAAGSHLMNLFVCHRQVGNLEISVPTKYDLSCSIMSVNPEAQMSTYNFHTSKPDDHHYIKTYNFRLKDLEASKDKTKHYLPISLKTGLERKLDPEIVKIIKAEHDIGALIRKDKPDFTLISSSGSRFDSHSIVLLAHSAVLRDQLRGSTVQSLTLDVTDEEMEILLNFMYTGTVKDIAKQNKSKLLDLGSKFDLPNLSALASTM